MVSSSDTLQDPAAFLKQAVLVARIGPWRLYPGLARIEVSPQWVEVFRVDKPPTTFPQYLALIDPDDRKRVAGETKRAFVMGEAKHWESTFQAIGAGDRRRHRHRASVGSLRRRITAFVNLT